MRCGLLLLLPLLLLVVVVVVSSPFSNRVSCQCIVVHPMAGGAVLMWHCSSV
jgi:hypothetical protein